VYRTGSAELWQATAPPEAVLGMFLERNEGEVIVDPDRLRDINTVETYVGERNPEVD
jgi:hypothetical protein